MKSILLCLFLFASASAWAEIAVIVHPSNNASLNESDINRLFMGKMKSFSDGIPAIPINQESGTAVREEFQQKVLKKSGSQIKAYWSKLVFTGKGAPPKEVSNDAEVIKLISNNPNLIGYIDASAVTGGVKVIGKF